MTAVLTYLSQNVAATIALLALALMTPGLARADAVGLQLAPLKYDQTLTAKRIQEGTIDIGNPSDAAVAVETSVQGFRQTNSNGDLSYYNDATLSAAIMPDLHAFNLGPREAVRMTFSIDPNKLPNGGIYAVIFFRTVPVNQSATSSFVTQSARVGTLLILNNGGVAPVGGSIANFGVPQVQLGDGIGGSFDYRMMNGSVAVSPTLSSRIYPWGKAVTSTNGLVLPGNTRSFKLQRVGSYFGLVPISLTDTRTGQSVTAWSLVCTGWYQTLIALLVAFGTAQLVRTRLNRYA
jgi:hypothetical protein